MDTAPATPAAPIASQSGASVSLSGTGTSGDVIRVFRGGVLLGSTTVVAGSWSYDAGLQADGTHTFTTVAVDPAGNVSGTSSATTVTVVTPSTVTAVSPTTVAGTGGTTITLTGTNLTATTAVTLGGVAATGVSVINATTVRCEEFFFETADGKDAPTQGHLACHGDIFAHRNTRQKRNNRCTHGDTRRRTIFGDGPFWNVDMDIVLFKKLGINAIMTRPRTYITCRCLDRFLHDLS